MVCCMASLSAPICAPICGNAGKMVSMENGPNIDSPPSSNAKRRKEMGGVTARGWGNAGRQDSSGGSAVRRGKAALHACNYRQPL